MIGDCCNERGAEISPRIFGRDRQARWNGQPAGADALARKTDGLDPRSQTRSDQIGEVLASSRPHTVKAQVTRCT